MMDDYNHSENESNQEQPPKEPQENAALHEEDMSSDTASFDQASTDDTAAEQPGQQDDGSYRGVFTQDDLANDNRAEQGTSQSAGWTAPGQSGQNTQGYSYNAGQGAQNPYAQSSYGQSYGQGQYQQQNPYAQGGYNQQPGYGQGGYAASPYSGYQPQEPAADEAKTEYEWNLPDYDDPAGGTSEKPKKKNRGLLALTIVLAVAFVLTATGFAGYAMYKSGVFGGETTSGDTNGTNDKADIALNDKPATSDSASADGKMTTQDIAKKVRPSVVGVVTYSRQTAFQASGQGSGIIMSDDGYIVTNAHVVDGADSIRVVLNNDEEYTARLIGSDTKTDLAVVKINAKNLTKATFGNSSQVEVGETVVAIGNPGGLEFAGSVTQGIVSAVDRNVSGLSNSGYSLKCIQTDAAINPGNSGGALVNLYGQVIGINSSKIAATEYEGIGFSIPINEAKPIIDNLMSNGYVKDRVKIGITFQEIDESLARLNEIPSGLYVVDVDRTLDVYKKGVQKGDIITKIDGKAVSDSESVTNILKKKKPGQTVKLTIYRQTVTGKATTTEVDVILAEDKGSATASDAIPR